MDDLITELMKLYAKEGILGMITVGLGTAAAMAAASLLRGVAEPLVSRLLGRRAEAPPLRDHLIFKKYDFIRDTKLPQIAIKCPLRRLIFTRLISIRLESHKKSALAFVSEDYSGMNVEELKLAVREFIYGSRNSWVLAAREAKIPEIVISKYNERTCEIKSVMHDSIDTACSSESVYPTNLHRLNGVLDLLMTLEENLYAFLEQVLDNLNGELSRVEYEGVRCVKCADCPHSRKKGSAPPAWTPAAGLPATALHVEDDPASLAIVSSRLTPEGFRVVAVRSLAEAYQEIGRHKFDAAILGDCASDGAPRALVPALTLTDIPFVFATTSGVSPMEGAVAHSKLADLRPLAESLRRQMSVASAIRLKQLAGARIMFARCDRNEPRMCVVFLCPDKMAGEMLQSQAVAHKVEVAPTASVEEAVHMVMEMSACCRSLALVDDRAGEAAMDRVATVAASYGVTVAVYGAADRGPRGEPVVKRSLGAGDAMRAIAGLLEKGG